MGVYDTPATIDYILNTTGHSSVIALGHSLGSTNVLVAASMRPEYQDKVKLNILWAQSVYMGNIKVRDWFDVLYSVYVVSYFCGVMVDFGSGCLSPSEVIKVILT